MDLYYSLDRYTQSIIIFIASVAVGFLIRFLFLTILKFSTARSHDVVITSIYGRMRKSWLLFIPLTLFHIFFPAALFNDHSVLVVTSLTRTFIIISVAVLAIRLVNVFQDVVMRSYDTHKTDNVRERKIRTQLSFLKRIMIIGIVILTAALILLSFDGVRKYGAALVTSAGVAGIIIGFAAQKTLANFLAGFQIAFTQPIKIDDAVVVEGEWGWIEEINLTYVVVKIWDLRRLILPITYFVEKPFQNWTRVTADLLGSVFLYVDYTVPLDALRKEFDNVLEASTLWDRKAKVLQVVESTEKAMQLRLLMGARNSPEAWDLRCEVREKMIVFIQQNYPESLPRNRTEFLGMDAEPFTKRD